MTKQSNIVTPDAKELRKFALSIGPVFILIFGVVLPWVFGKSWPLWPWLIGGALILWGIVHPVSLGPIYRGWMKLGLILNKIVSPVVLGVIFFLLVTPLALIMRMKKKELVAAKFDKSISTYRVPTETQAREHFERPF